MNKDFTKVANFRWPCLKMATSFFFFFVKRKSKGKSLAMKSETFNWVRQSV